MSELKIENRKGRSTYSYVVVTKDGKEVEAFQTKKSAVKYIEDHKK